MALLNKLFPSRKKGGRRQENVCDRFFEFGKDQVQVILFRECDFRGKRLLFDSKSIKRIPVNQAQESNEEPKTEKYVEISNGYGYMFTKPQMDIKQTGEMIFGSVAMSYRGTSYKIHSLKNPNRLMYTQVFPSPRSSCKYKRPLPHNSLPANNTSTCSSLLETSFCSEDFEMSSMNSISGQYSCSSASSEAMLVSRDGWKSTPVDVPVKLQPSPVNGDSGFSGEFSFSSVSSGPVSMPLSPLEVSFSSGSLYKRWLRSKSTSLERSGGHLNSSASADECVVRPNQRSSKLGLTIIIWLNAEQEEAMTNFLMEHASLVEAMIWRARHEVEVAYIRSHLFVSLMYETTQMISQCLVDFFTGNQLYSPLWLSLSKGCDKVGSISESVEKATDAYGEDGGEFNFLRFLVKSGGGEKEGLRDRKEANRTYYAEKFVSELCELLETFDIKHTNFFISTLLTAVLTHHLGWVATCMPPAASDERITSDLHNALWGQLTDLYGAVGHPTKVAHTVVSGTNNGEMISKILNSLTYFIRCTEVERQSVVRADVKQENAAASDVCEKSGCIPKEYYKKFEDHLKEFGKERRCVKGNDWSCGEEKGWSWLKGKRGDWRCDEKGKWEGLCLGNEEGERRLKEECVSAKENKEESDETFRKTTNGFEKNNVVFTLGDSDHLIGLKTETSEPTISNVTCKSKSLKRNKTYFNLLNGCDNDTEEPEPIKTKQKQKPLTRRGSSCIDLTQIETPKFNGAQPKKPTEPETTKKPRPITLNLHTEEPCCSSRHTVRSQSVPPSDPKPEDSTNRKYRYSGIKFNFQQYPQIAANYLKSKNIELSDLAFARKELELGQPSGSCELPDFGERPSVSEELDALQTPSNASELECISEMVLEREKEPKVEEKKKNGIIDEGSRRMETVYLSMPRSSVMSNEVPGVLSYSHSLMRGVGERYTSDMVLQGTSAAKSEWEAALRRDLILAARHPLLDQPIEEAVAIIANTDTWEVQLMSSHTYVVDKGSTGVRVGMSQLVANMLESLLQMWKLQTPAEHCLLHIEQRLQEFCVRSQALAHLLLATEFCSMELLTSTLQLEVNDVPLLMSIASTHSPQVTEKYGLSFQ